MNNLSKPDFTKHPPRSVRVRLGGYAHLPRLLDKARAQLRGKPGDYHYNCPLDHNFFEFTGISHKKMLAAVKTGKSDTEMLAWVGKNTDRTSFQIATWSNWVEQHGPGGRDGHLWIADTLKKIGPKRTDVRSFADLLDLDDYVSYGGQG
ncbi:MAG: DUF5069 domain-containing protein [Opitutaceae bacterium]